MIQIGTVIQGYKVYGICDKYCIARNISPRVDTFQTKWTLNGNLQVLRSHGFRTM